MNYKNLQYKKENLSSIKSFKKNITHYENEVVEMKNDLYDFLSEKHERDLEAVLLGKKPKEVLIDIIRRWLTDEAKNTQGYTIEKLIKTMIDNIVGWGKLQPLIEDTAITDIHTNEKLEVLKRVNGEDLKTNIKFEDEEEIEDYIKAIMLRVKQTISNDECIQDAYDSIYNVRIQVAINGSPIKKEVVRKPYIVLRLKRVKEFTREYFIGNGTFNEKIADFLENEINDTNTLIVGAPNHGKTTLLEYIRMNKSKKYPMRKVIRIEEEVETIFEAENSVSFFERKSNNKDDTRRKYTMVDFAKAATRLSGHDVVVGEVRGAEAWALARLFDMGYHGETTIHGKNCESGLRQLSLLMSMDAPNMSMKMLYQRACDIIDFVVFLSHKKIISIAEVIGYDYEKDTPILNYIFNLNTDESGEMYYEEGKLSDQYVNRKKIESVLMDRKV